MALLEEARHNYDDLLLIENLQLVREVSGFFPLTERELFEAASISVPDRPSQGAAEHVSEVIRHQETRGYEVLQPRDVGASLVREYAQYFRGSTTLVVEVEQLQSKGVHSVKIVDAPILAGARSVVQFADLAAFQLGRTLPLKPLVTKYRSHGDEMQRYIKNRIEEIPVRELVHKTAETLGHVAARRAFWGRALTEIGANIPKLRSHVENVFQFSPLERR